MMDLKRLADFFPPEKIEFRIGATNEKRDKNKNVSVPATKAIALPYVTNRAIQDRLDSVCGAENWKNEFLPWKGEHQLCGISIKIDGEWVTKWDGAENTHAEPLKGGLSASMKRAAAQWGIGRYLYDVPNRWVDVTPSGRGYKFTIMPELPPEFLPKGTKNKGYVADVATDDERELANIKNNQLTDKITPEMGTALSEVILRNGIDPNKILKWAHVEALQDLTIRQFYDLMDIYSQNIPDFQKPQIDISEKEKEKLKTINRSLGARP